MAISGTGAQNDPYLVASVSDISDAITAVRAKTDAGTYYIKLTASIDGSWSKFPVLDFDDTTTKFFDFDGGSTDSTPKTITNFVFDDGVLFGVNGDIIRNTTLYNFYTDDDSNGYIKGVESINSSLSCRVDSHKVAQLDGIKMTRSAFWSYVENYDTAEPLVKFRESSATPGSDDNSNECDYMLKVVNVNHSSSLVKLFSDPGLATVGVDSRIQGHITNITPSTIARYPAICDGNTYFENSVINFDMPAYSGTVSGNATDIVPVGSTGIINSDKILETTYCNYTMNNLIAVTDTEMHSASQLTAKGFPVYDITP